MSFVDMNGILERHWSRRKINEVETFGEFTYLGSSVSVDAGFEAAVTSMVRFL